MSKEEYIQVPNEDYKKWFNELQTGKSNRSDLSPLKIALDTRKFEIELYWKRATFFWAFLATIYTAYFFVHSISNNEEFFLLVLSFLASCFSLLWYLSNRGSKFWQENWEAHVSALEETEIGPLFKTIKDPTQYDFWKLTGAYDFSVSKVNIIASIIILVISIILFIKSIITFFKIDSSEKLGTFLINHNILSLGVCFLFLLGVLVVIICFSKGFASKITIKRDDSFAFVMKEKSYKKLKNT